LRHIGARIWVKAKIDGFVKSSQLGKIYHHHEGHEEHEVVFIEYFFIPCVVKIDFLRIHQDWIGSI